MGILNMTPDSFSDGGRNMDADAAASAAVDMAAAGASIIDIGGESTRRSEEHTSELQSLMRISYAVFCLKKTTKTIPTKSTKEQTSIECNQSTTLWTKCTTNHTDV